jgi:2-polyprenyl-3-methyl-5-hydroxy-6-metoxy-1,4-benzoquinol methylase
MMAENATSNPSEVIARIRERVRARQAGERERPTVRPQTGSPFLQQSVAVRHDLDKLRADLAACNALHNAVGNLNPRPPGLINAVIQFTKKAMRRSLSWYTRPLHEFHGAVTRTLNEMSIAVQQLRAELDTVPAQLASIRSELDYLRRDLLRSVDTGEGAKARAGLYFNEPVMVDYEENGRAYWAATSERIVERSWLFRETAGLPQGCKILDVGCCESLLSFELASSGFEVVGIDVRDYPLRHPRLRFLRADICATGLQDASFDAAVALSTLEHIGLGFYGDTQDKAAIDAAMKEILRLLRPNSKLLVSVPFGRAAMTPQHRIFDADALRSLLSGFNIEKLEFAVKLDSKTWRLPASEMEAAAQPHDPQTYSPSAVALAVCRKPGAND